MRYNKKLVCLFVFLVVFVTSAQNTQMKVGNNPYTLSSPSAVLELESTNKGFLPPRMTSVAMNSISSPAQGLMVYCTDCTQGKGLYFYNGTSWVAAVSASDTTGATPSSKGRVSAFVSRGVDVTLGNLRVRVPASGNVSLQISTVSGTYQVAGMLTSIANEVFVTRAVRTLDVTTTPKYISQISADTYVTRGDTCIWRLADRTGLDAWRITLVVNFPEGVLSYFISIEQL